MGHLLGPALLEEEIYVHQGDFCSVKLGRSIYSSHRVVIGIIRKLVKRRISNEIKTF